MEDKVLSARIDAQMWDEPYDPTISYRTSFELGRNFYNRRPGAPYHYFKQGHKRSMHEVYFRKEKGVATDE